MPVRAASISEHEKIMKVARQSKYTRDFSNHIFSSEQNYNNGWIGVYKRKGGRTILGFICLRHAVRKKETVVYQLGVDEDSRRSGIGRELIEWAMHTSPYKVVSLNVDKENSEAIKFYRKIGFRKVGEGVWKNGHEYITMKWRT